MGTRKRFSIIISATDKATGPLKRTQLQIQAIGKSMRRTGRSMTMGLSLPILAFGGFTIKAAADFEAAMNRVRGITRANAEEFKFLRDQAKDLGRTTQFSASQAAAAQESLARKGFDVAEIHKALPAILELAASSSVELAEAADLGAGMMRGFGLEAKDLSRINDRLVTANLETNTTLATIVEAMKEVAPVAHAMGISLSESAAVAGLLGDALLEGGRGGVAMKNILSKLANATPAAQRVLQDLKIPRDSIMGPDGPKSIIAIIDALNKSGAKAPAIFEIFGQRAAPAVLALMARGADTIKDLTEKIEGPDSLNEANRQAAIRMEGAEGAMKEFKSSVEGLQIAIGDSGLLGAFEALVRKLTGWTQELAESNPAMLKAGTVIAGVLAVVGPLLIVFGALAASIKVLLPAFAFLWKGVLFLVAAFKLLLVVVGIIATAIGAPLWLVVAGIAALIAGGIALVKYWEPVKAFFKRLPAILSAPMIAMGGPFLAIIGFASLLLKAWDPVRLFFANFGENISIAFGSLGAAAERFGAFLGLGDPTVQLAAAGAAGGGGPPPVPPPAQAHVSGLVGIKVESDLPARVTTLESSGDVEIDVDSGPGMSGF